MRRQWWAIMALLAAGGVRADDSFDGYSYAALGLASLHYAERPSLVPFKTSVTAHDTLFQSGGLFAVNDTIDFSLDTSTALLPGTATENWKANGRVTWTQGGGGSVPDGTVVQTDDFQMNNSSIRGLLHYKLNDKLRLVGGLSYLSTDSKRFLATTNFPTLINTSNSLVDEQDNTVSLGLGSAYESRGLARDDSRWRVRGVLDLPLLRHVTNTAVSQTLTQGHDWGVDLSAAWDMRVYKGLELGVLSEYTLRKGSRTDFSLANGGTGEYPEHTLTQWFLGLELGWNLSRK